MGCSSQDFRRWTCIYIVDVNCREHYVDNYTPPSMVRHPLFSHVHHLLWNFIHRFLVSQVTNNYVKYYIILIIPFIIYKKQQNLLKLLIIIFMYILRDIAGRICYGREKIPGGIQEY